MDFKAGGRIAHDERGSDWRNAYFINTSTNKLHVSIMTYILYMYWCIDVSLFTLTVTIYMYTYIYIILHI